MSAAASSLKIILKNNKKHERLLPRSSPGIQTRSANLRPVSHMLSGVKSQPLDCGVRILVQIRCLLIIKAFPAYREIRSEEKSQHWIELLLLLLLRGCQYKLCKSGHFGDEVREREQTHKLCSCFLVISLHGFYDDNKDDDDDDCCYKLSTLSVGENRNPIK